MKNLVLSLFLLAAPVSGFATRRGYEAQQPPLEKALPSSFLSSSVTDVIEWGCPVSEMVRAGSKAEAMEHITQACMEDVRHAANSKPGVFEVIQTSVIWPDIKVLEANGGFYLEGTFFFETLVMREADGRAE